MSSNKDFYIGYMDEMDPDLRKFLRKRVMMILGIFVLMGVLFSTGQYFFAQSTFELGKVVEVQGVFYRNPYPMLRMEEDGEVRDVMLVDFGKYGADHRFEKVTDFKPIEGANLTLEGSRIYYDGKDLLQIQPNTPIITGISLNNEFVIEEKGEVQMKGEIVDPKCFFGVMRPGFGKVHRSCAIRCISGGIPPVFAVENNGGIEYYILTDELGRKIGPELASVIGKYTSIKGKLTVNGSWNILAVDPDDIQILDKSRYYDETGAIFPEFQDTGHHLAIRSCK